MRIDEVEPLPHQRLLVVEDHAVQVDEALRIDEDADRRSVARVGITGGGCSGLSYNIRFDTQPRDRDRVYAFSQTHLDPEATDAPPIRIFVDPKSFIYLHGMILDYEETLMRQGFNFINPHSTKSCGCGSSFST